MDGPSGNPRGRALWRVTAFYAAADGVPATRFVHEYESLSDAYARTAHYLNPWLARKYARTHVDASSVAIERVWRDA